MRAFYIVAGMLTVLGILLVGGTEILSLRGEISDLKSRQLGAAIEIADMERRQQELLADAEKKQEAVGAAFQELQEQDLEILGTVVNLTIAVETTTRNVEKLINTVDDLQEAIASLQDTIASLMGLVSDLR